MGRVESKTPLLENYGNGSSTNDSPSRSSEFPRGQVLIGDDVPPPYADTSTSTELPNRHHINPSNSRDVRLNHNKYGILSAKTERDDNGSKTTVISHSLGSDPKLLGDFISTQTRLMPNPLVRMVGTHTETTTTTTKRRMSKKKRKTETTVTDFDISISAADLLAPAWRRTRVVENAMKAYRGGRRRTVATGYTSDLEPAHTAPPLEEWYHRFCASTASLKTYGHFSNESSLIYDSAEMLILYQVHAVPPHHQP